MREISSGNPNTRIQITDAPGPGGANHVYLVRDNHPADDFQGARPFADVRFQKGPIQENGVNGCHQEDLLAIVIDRLRSFQQGPFPCRENALALTHCEEAMHWLNHRTADRFNRNVEGQSKA
jgi:hypothetical protein